jgi:hypothetical protein
VREEADVALLMAGLPKGIWSKALAGHAGTNCADAGDDSIEQAQISPLPYQALYVLLESGGLFYTISGLIHQHLSQCLKAYRQICKHSADSSAIIRLVDMCGQGDRQRTVPCLHPPAYVVTACGLDCRTTPMARKDPPPPRKRCGEAAAWYSNRLLAVLLD